MSESGLPIVTHDDRVVFGVQKSDIGLETIEGLEWWRECRRGEQYGWFKPETKSMKGLTAFGDGKSAILAGYRPVFERLKNLAKGVLLTAKSNELTISSDLWAPTFETRYRVMYTGLRLAMRRGIVRYRGGYSRYSRQAGEALRHRLKRYAYVKRYEHNLTIPADIGNVLLSELKQHCEQGGRWADSPTGNIYLKGSLPKDKTTLKVHAYRMGEDYGKELAGRVKVEVVLRKDALKGSRFRRVQYWPNQPGIQASIEKVLRRQWKGVFAMAPKAKTMLLDRTGTKTDEQLFEFMLRPENTLAGVLRRVEALERDRERLKREQVRHAQRLAALEAKKL